MLYAQRLLSHPSLDAMPCHAVPALATCSLPLILKQVINSGPLIEVNKAPFNALDAFPPLKLAEPQVFSLLLLLHPITTFILRLSKKPLKSSFLTSTTQCSKLSMRTLAFVSATTSWNAVPNLLRP